MINLLPNEDKRQLNASRANTMLLRYNIFLLGALVFLGLAIGGTYFYLTTTKANAENRISTNQAEVSNYQAVEAQAKSFRANLATAKAILDKEVTYTKAVLAISQLIPSGIVLQNLNLDSTTFGTPTTLNIQAKNVDAAVNLKNAFQNSNLFSNVHFESISTADASSESEYPVTVMLNVTINKGAAQ